ncbi:MAG: acyl-CoA synthetase [Thermodesulfobacteriota bacterium]
MPFDYKALCASWEWNIPRKFNIGVDCVDRHAANPETANFPALIFENAEGFSSVCTFHGVKTVTDKMANALLFSGIKQTDRIVIMLDNIPQFPFSFVAALKIGAIPIPASAMLTADEITHILNDSGAKAVVTSPELYGNIETARGKCPKLETVFITKGVFNASGEIPSRCVDFDELYINAPEDLKPADTLAEDIAYICYTSGTTGEPKGVAHAHRSVIGRDPAAVFWTGVNERPVVFHAGKLNWTYTLGAGCLDPWRHGCACVIYGGEYEPLKMFELIEKYKVNVFMTVPTVFRQMARAAGGKSPNNISTLTHCLSAGEHLSAELFAVWKNTLGVSLYEGLGMSEFSYYISNMRAMEIKPGSPGLPQPGRKCFLADPETCKPVPADTEGVLCSAPGDPGIMLGYWNRPDETRAMYSKKGDFVSGDYFTQDKDGYLWTLGRKDDMINSFGYRISPFEVETAIMKHGNISDCAVAGIDSGEGKIISTAFVVPQSSGAQELLKKDLQTFLSARLAPYKIPKEIVFTNSIPRTKNGKKKRGELRLKFGAPT